MRNTRSDTLESFERHSTAKGVVYVCGEQLETAVPLLREGVIQAAILRETSERKAQREAFIASLTPEHWQVIEQFMPKMRGAKNGRSDLQYNFISATHPDIPMYLVKEIEASLSDIIKLNPDYPIANSEILMRPPNSGRRAKYWTFHQDTNFPITEHVTICGSGLEWLDVELTDEQKYLLARDYSGFLESITDENIHTVEQGDAIWFNDEFLHRATSHAATQGYIVKSTSPAMSPFPLPR